MSVEEALKTLIELRGEEISSVDLVKRLVDDLNNIKTLIERELDEIIPLVEKYEENVMEIVKKLMLLKKNLSKAITSLGIIETKITTIPLEEKKKKSKVESLVSLIIPKKSSKPINTTKIDSLVGQVDALIRYLSSYRLLYRDKSPDLYTLTARMVLATVDIPSEILTVYSRAIMMIEASIDIINNKLTILLMESERPLIMRGK